MTSLYNINYLQHLCKKFGLIPSKKYGQNFLINEEPIAKMLEAAEITKDDVVVEVGPGFGVLTLALAEKAQKVLAFEIEKKLEPYWNELKEIKKLGNLEIIWGNILYEIKNLKIKNYKIISNLPYQITSNVIRKFLETENKPELMVLMVQKEVAERICAKPGDMSVLAISVQCSAEPEIVMYVPKSYFWPVPGVDSAVIKIRSRELGVGSRKQDEGFFKIVKAGFANRRKMLIKNLSSVMDKKKLPAIFKELGISDKARAQELSVEQWISLVRKL
ncbi:MAG: 16S rRNA (adenine(1518)-N(6)/adenine(1519)-N(6))-dimethyltransferase RsmA [Patescibacteria group bacterium]